jgi:ribonuclease P protein component
MYTFKKEERLCSKKLIEKLYHNGSSFLLYPFRITWLPDDEGTMPAQILVSVSKKRYKRAVDRNLVKRRIREAYRLSKAGHLYPLLTTGQCLLLNISYIGKEITTFEQMQKKLIQAFVKLGQDLNHDRAQ